ncbi:hypothetical protein EK904_012918, partial [Melospiza melodia maxima]
WECCWLPHHLSLQALPAVLQQRAPLDVPQPGRVNVLLWGNLPALEESTEGDTSCTSEEEFIR